MKYKELSAYIEENSGKNILPLSIIENEELIGSKPIEIIVFYKKQKTISEIKECLLKTIEYYNIFSSRLIQIDYQRYALQYAADGFIANILPPVDATIDKIHVDDIKRMMAHVKTLPGEPLFAVTGFSTQDGTVGALSCSHAVADGISLFLFLFAWLSIVNGNPFPLPSKQRLFTGSPVNADALDKAFTPPLSELSNVIQNRIHYENNIKTYAHMDYFTHEFLDDMKNKAKRENANYILSNNQIINALLMKKYHRHVLPDTHKIVLRNPINLRDVHPDIDSLYIGNAYLDCTTEFTKDEIDNLPVYEIASRLKESIHNAKEETFVRKIAYLSKFGIEFRSDILNQYSPDNIKTDIVSSNVAHLHDLESLGMGSNVFNILHMDSAAQTSFVILKESSHVILAQTTGMIPFEAL
jgi:hypothetical protein